MIYLLTLRERKNILKIYIKRKKKMKISRDKDIKRESKKVRKIFKWVWEKGNFKNAKSRVSDRRSSCKQ